jgi:hypothetical protein
MNEFEEIAGRGSAERDEVPRSHSAGFNAAFDRALQDLDGQKYAGQELCVRYSITVSANPGGVGQYHVILSPPGP